MFSAGPSPNTKKLFFRLSVSDDEVLSTPKITIFLKKSLQKHNQPASSNTIPSPLKIKLL